MTAPAPDVQDWTIREIEQQPDIWAEVIAIVDERRDELDAWLKPLLQQRDLRIILTGAGSSAYIGEALAPYLTRHLGRSVEAISTTAIVGSPQDHLLAERPTLLVSYARSGNSPESVAAVNLANQLVPNCAHLIICCNADSALTNLFDEGANMKALLMPAAALDQSFAMTSSFTSMSVASLALFAPDSGQANAMVAAARQLLGAPRDKVVAIASRGFSRVVVLGSGSLHGIATEAALKTLELSAGQTMSYAESALGFRHGPKFVINADALIIFLPSPNAYTKQYDNDLFNELARDGAAGKILRLDQECGLDGTSLNEGWIGVVYLIWCQLFAYQNALRRNITPDNPCPTGEVNRVVQGVIIHDYPAS